MKPKLLMVVNVDWFFLSHRLPVALAALREGYEVHIACGLTMPETRLTEHGLVVHALSLKRGSNSLGEAVSLTCGLIRLFRYIKPDVIHLVTIKPVLLGGIAARWVRAPAVVAAVSGLGHVFAARGWLARVRLALANGAYRHVFGHPNLCVIVQNRDDLVQLQRDAGLDHRRASLLRGSGVDLSAFTVRERPPGPPLVLLAARLLAEKGVREFVAVAQALHGYRGARFVLVGEPDPDNPSSVDAAELGRWAASGALECWGFRSDMAEVLASASIVVLPSYREGLPKLLAEAAACGRAVVTTDVPGCRDAVRAGQTALLVPPRDVVGLTEALRQLLDDPDLCCRLGAQGRRMAEEWFDLNFITAQHLQIYAELRVRAGCRG